MRPVTATQSRHLGDSVERTIEQHFSVTYEYPVIFLRGLFGREAVALGRVLERFAVAPGAHRRLLAVLDQGLVERWPELAKDIRHHVSQLDSVTFEGEPLVVPGGEAVKNDPRMLDYLHRTFFDLALDRHSFVMAVGGGAVLDAVGFAAATAHRGLRLIRVPTTVLSQADSGVGVKNGVNSFQAKNFLGTFVPPVAVLNDFDFLATLGSRDRAAGMAEAVKVGLIRDRAFFEWLEVHAAALHQFEPSFVEQLIERTAALHLAHIAGSGDPFEQGSARPLDYGHWAAHKLESLTANELRHGEAVAIGMAIDTAYSAAKGMLAVDDAERIYRLLEQLGLPTWHEALDQIDERGERAFLGGLEEFRQHLGGELSVTLLEALGRAKQVETLDEALLVAVADELKERVRGEP